MPLINRTYAHSERKWIQEFLGVFRAGQGVEYEKRLTLAPSDKPLSLRSGVKPRAGNVVIAKLDAFIAAPDHVELWEAKQHPQFASVAQLLQYANAWPKSAESEAYKGLRVELHLLASHDSEHVRLSAADAGIMWHQYLPEWLRATQLASEQAGIDRRNAALAAKNATNA